MTLGAMYNVMGTPPVLNERTAYTTLMEVGSGHMETWLRDCDSPCHLTTTTTTTTPTTVATKGEASLVKYNVLAMLLAIASLAHFSP